MKKTFLALSIIFLSISTYAQFNKFGYPFYTYYDSKDYNAYDQNWDIIEDHNGLIYVANNNDGILQFDGETWRKIEIKNKPEVRAFGMDNNGIIFVGCSSDFGFLEPTVEGDLVFKSLLDKFDHEKWEFSYIFKVNAIADTVFFSSENSLLFRYLIKEDTVVVTDLPQYTLFTFEANQKLYGSGILDGLYTNFNDTVKTVNGGEFYKGKNIFSILPDDDNNLTLITGKQGIFRFNEPTGISSQLLSNNDLDYLKQVITYSAEQTADDILLATIGSGVVSCNKKGKLETVYDQQIGIKDHVCASVNAYRNSIWCALGLGLSRFENTSPFRFFSKESNLEGYITDVVKFKNELFVATEIGLFYLHEEINKPPAFIKIEGIDEQIRSLVRMTPKNLNEEEFLIIGTIEGIYQLNDKTEKVQLIEENLYEAEKFFKVDLDKVDNESIRQSFYANALYADANSNKLWVSTKFLLFCIEYNGKKWKLVNEKIDLTGGIDYITKDKFENIWGATKQNGLIKVDSKTQKLIKYDIESGLPENHSLKVFNSPIGLYCGSSKGIYKFNSSSDSFEKDTIFPQKYTNGNMGVTDMLFDKDNNIYLSYFSAEKKGIDRIVLNSGKYESKDEFKRLGSAVVNCFYEDDNIIWFGVSDILYSYNKSANFNYKQAYNCLIRKVEGLDSTYFKGTYIQETPQGLRSSNYQHPKQKPIFEYSHNDITFHYAAPYYEGAEAIKYSYQLAGFKKDWSKWNSEPKAVFTNLNEGQYTFKVKAKNIYEIESSVGEYSFAILPPWYRTILAYFLYVVLALFAVWVIVKMYTRRLKQEKIRLEGIVRERTAEIREQRDEIADQKKSIEDSILYARRIQRAILPSDELAQEILPEHFILFRPRDIVSGDYFWMNKIGHHTIILAADCTGHGVPGAFMSMLGVSFLNEIVLKDNITEPHLILNKLRDKVKITLKQEGKDGEAKDGMDVAVVVIDEQNKKLLFAGAYNPVYIYRGAELFEIKADRMPIGIYIKERESFTLSEYKYEKGDTFYIFSDGYPDQFGGLKGQKFRTKALKELLSKIQDKSMAEQNEILNKTIVEWMGDENEQIDDMVVVGVRM